MSIAAILGAITALGAIAGMVTYLVKTGVWVFTKTPQTKKEEVDQDVDKHQQDFKSGGRPT